MGIFNRSTEEKWVKNKSDAVWNRLFTSLDEKDILITKCMVWNCVNFADKLLSSNAFNGENTAMRVETILLAKMQFYHLVTRSQTVHNLFYGYIFELFVNHYRMGIGDANAALAIMHSREKWYFDWYYDFYETPKGSFVNVMKEYCDNARRNKNADDGEPILAETTDQLARRAALLLMDMHNNFIDEMPSSTK